MPLAWAHPAWAATEWVRGEIVKLDPARSRITLKHDAIATGNGMVCAFCAQGIEKRLSRLPATHAVDVDAKQKVVLVEAREGQTLDAKTITAEITDAGYDVTKLETVEQSVAEIKAGMNARK